MKTKLFEQASDIIIFEALISIYSEVQYEKSCRPSGSWALCSTNCYVFSTMMIIIITVIFLLWSKSHCHSSTFVVKAALNSNCKATWWKRASFCILNLTSKKRIGLHKIEIKASNIFMLYACLKCFCLHCFLLCCCCFLWRRLYVTLVFFLYAFLFLHEDKKVWLLTLMSLLLAN